MNWGLRLQFQSAGGGVIIILTSTKSSHRFA